MYVFFKVNKKKSSKRRESWECVFFYNMVACQFLFSASIYVRMMWSFPLCILEQHVLCFRGAVTRSLRYARVINREGFAPVTGTGGVHEGCLP